MTNRLTVPDYPLMDRYWRGMLHLFSNHYKLQTVLTSQYFNLEDQTIRVPELKKATKGWSKSEKFMMDLALHLYDSSNKVDLSGMDYLDKSNTQLALEAITMRYG